MVNTVPQMKFGIVFNEASSTCLSRVDGNAGDLKAVATRNFTAVGGRLANTRNRFSGGNGITQRNSAT